MLGIDLSERCTVTCMSARRRAEIHGKRSASSAGRLPAGGGSQMPERWRADRKSRAGDEHKAKHRHGRTQWDAMMEAIGDSRFRATKLAILIAVRYWWRAGATGVAFLLTYKLIAMMTGHH